MTRMTGLRVVVTAAVLFALAACSSSGDVTVRQGLSNGIPPGKVVALTVANRPIENQSEDDAEEGREIQRRLKGQLFGRLVSEGVFKQVVQPGEEADYRMQVMLTSAEEVSQGARIFLGVLAGANSLTATVELFELPADSRIADFSVEGESASHPFSTEAGLDDAVREAVSKIILELQS